MFLGDYHDETAEGIITSSPGRETAEQMTESLVNKKNIEENP